MSGGYEDRKRLTFEQAEGAEPLPSQLALKEVSQELRAGLWQVVHDSVMECTDRYAGIIGEPWLTILRDQHVRRHHRFECRLMYVQPDLQRLFQIGDYLDIFGFIEWVLRHDDCPVGLALEVAEVLDRCRAAYTIIDADTIMQIGSRPSVRHWNRHSLT